MSIYAQFDENGNQYQISSNLGWSEFGEWVESLTAMPALKSLYEHGVSEDIPAVTQDLSEAIESESPENEDVLSTAELFLDALNANQDAELLLTTQ